MSLTFRKYESVLCAVTGFNPWLSKCAEEDYPKLRAWEAGPKQFGKMLHIQHHIRTRFAQRYRPLALPLFCAREL